MSSPLISIIVPTFNRAQSLVACLESICNQTYPHFEAIIVDDGSTDNTSETVQPFLSDKRFQYHGQVNMERGAARNNGALLAKGSWVNFFDSDDIMYPNHLAAAAKCITENPAIRFLHTGYRIVEQGKVLKEETGFIDDPISSLIVTNFLGCDSVFVERHLFLENRFNPDRKLASSEDWELWLRLISRETLHSCEDITLEMHHHPGRSLLTISAERIVERDLLLLNSLFADVPFRKRFKDYLRAFEADRYTFFMLVFSEQKQKRMVMKWAMRAVRVRPFIVTNKRFLASIKNILLR